MTTYLRLPKDQDGYNYRHELRTDVYIDSESLIPQIGHTLTGAISGAYGTLVGVERKGSKIIYFLADVAGRFDDNENLLNDDDQIVANTQRVNRNVYTVTNHITDPDTPEYIQKVNKYGAALTTFPEGTPQFDAFGKMQVGQMQAIGEYSHVGEDLAGKFWTYTTNGGTVTHDVQTSSLVYETTSASGSTARRTTNQYHPYKPGTSQYILMTVACGDAGRANVVREWGYFDDNNGVGFRKNGTQLQVFLRSDVSGTVVETVVNQNNWSDNTVDDPVFADFELNTSKTNIYWIDMAWLGSGRVRLGVMTPDGRRITCHTFQNANAHSLPYMRTGTLPLTWQQRNTGIVDVTGGTPKFRVICASVFSETADVLYQGELMHISPPKPIVLNNSDVYVPFLSFKAKSEVNGIPNTIIGIHETFDWCSIGDSPIHVGIFVLPNESYLTGHQWTETFCPQTMLYVDTSATSIPQTQVWGNNVSFTGSIENNILTVTNVASGTIDVGMFISGTNVATNTTIKSFLGGSGGVGSYIVDISQNTSSTAMTGAYPIKPIESFIAATNSTNRTALGDRIEKSFGLGGNLNVAEGDKPVFVFAAKVLKPATTVNFFYTKYWKEIR